MTKFMAMFTLLLVLAAEIASAPSQTTPPLVQSTNFVYQGAFRVPLGYDYAGNPITYNAEHDSLYLVTLNKKVGEITIPTAKITSTIGELSRAVTIQAPKDLFNGQDGQIDGGGSDLVIGGLLPFNQSLFVTVYRYYDGNGSQSKSHFKTGQDFSNLGTVVGPVVVSTSFRNPGAGFVDGWMLPVPAEWQGALGGPVLTGNGAISIISRSSFGPALSSFDPTNIGTVNPVPSTALLGYPEGHTTLGGYGPDGSAAYFNGSMKIAGAIFPPGTSSVVFFGHRGTKFCYGTGTSNPALDHQPIPQYPAQHYCYDPVNGGQGTHGYPYEHFAAFYDVNDLVAVKNGTKKPWEVFPYEKWTFNVPFQIDERLLLGVTYDPATQRVFMSFIRQDGYHPLIHVFKLNIATPPALAPTATVSVSACVVTPSATPPDTTGGWTPVFTIDGQNNLSVSPGSHSLVVTWNKPGEVTRISPATTIVCQ